MVDPRVPRSLPGPGDDPLHGVRRALEVDVDGRRGRLSIPGYVEMTGEPIRNKVSGEESRAQIVLPAGFEYEVADIGSASSRTIGGPMQVEIDSKYGQFARIHLSSHGVVRG